jgi:alpha-beta hydrolase superfamily lysophospholipase
MNNLMKKVLRIAGGVGVLAVLGYIAACIWLYKGQEKAIFFPRTIAVDAQLDITMPHVEVFIDVPDGARIHGVLFPAENPKGAVLHFHGNMENVLDLEGFAKHYVDMGFSFLATDYRSYGKSRGNLSEANMFRDATLFFDHLVDLGYAENDIVIFGRSIGTGVSLELASRKNPRAVVLYSAYFSMERLVSEAMPYFPVSLILRYPLDSATYMESVSCPVLILHGDADPVIPLKHAQALAGIHGELIVFEGGGHDNLTSFANFWPAVEKVINHDE